MSWTWRHGKGAERSDASGMRESFADLHRWKLVSTTEGVNTKVDHELLRQIACGPWVQRTYPDEKYVFQQIYCRSAPPGPPTVPGEILADWPPYSPDLNPLDFSMWSMLWAKFPATSHTNLDTLCLSIAVKRDEQVVEYICKTCHSFHHCRKPITRKN